MLGVLERIADVENLFTHLRFCKRDIILSYCATDLAKDADRSALGLVNHMSFYDLALLFDRYGFRIECTTPIDETQVLMRLTPTEWLSPVVSCNVAVISGDDGSDFSGRLGRHMINALLPGEAEVDHLTFRTLIGARPATTSSCSAPAMACFRLCSVMKSSTSCPAPRRRLAFSARNAAS